MGRFAIQTHLDDKQDVVWLSTVDRDCFRQVQDILIQNRKISTRRTFSSKWKRFSIGVTHHGLDHMQALVPKAPNYFLHLKQLLFSTIKVQAAAVSACHRWIVMLGLLSPNGIRVPEGPVTYIILVRELAPAWHLNVIFLRLMDSPFRMLCTSSGSEDSLPS